MPYDSITGTPNVSSKPVITGGGSAADEERINRRELRTGWIGRACPWARMASCIVGTAEYQLGFHCSSQPGNLSASNARVQIVLPPAPSDANTHPTSP